MQQEYFNLLPECIQEELIKQWNVPDDEEVIKEKEKVSHSRLQNKLKQKIKNKKAHRITKK